MRWTDILAFHYNYKMSQMSGIAFIDNKVKEFVVCFYWFFYAINFSKSHFYLYPFKLLNVAFSLLLLLLILIIFFEEIRNKKKNPICISLSWIMNQVLSMKIAWWTILSMILVFWLLINPLQWFVVVFICYLGTAATVMVVVVVVFTVVVKLFASRLSQLSCLL